MSRQHPRPPAVPRRTPMAAGLRRCKGKCHPDARHLGRMGQSWRSVWLAERESAAAEDGAPTLASAG